MAIAVENDQLMAIDRRDQLAEIGEPVDLEKMAAAYAELSRSAATRRAYRGDWRAWLAWCAVRGVCALPADPIAIASWLASGVESGRSIATMARALTSISVAHRLARAGEPTRDPIVRETWAGICRTKGIAPLKQALPLLPEHLRRICGVLPRTAIGARDRAILLFGFASALRRQELARVNVGDISDRPEGVRLVVRRSKTDQEGRGRSIGVPFGSDLCPIAALRDWLRVAGIESGAVFRRVLDSRRRQAELFPDLGPRLDGRSICQIVQRAAKLAGYDPSLYSGHSLRAGFCTAAAAAGATERAIARQTGHKSDRILRNYIREGGLFNEHPCQGLL